MTAAQMADALTRGREIVVPLVDVGSVVALLEALTTTRTKGEADES